MIWIKGLLGARWFLPALISIAAVVGGAYGLGRLHGFESSVSKIQAIFEDSTKDLKESHRQKIAAIEARHQRELDARKINEIPDIGPIGCSVPADGMLGLQQAVREANRIAGASAATAAND